MPRPFPAEFRLRAVALVRAGKPIATVAVQLGVSAAALHKAPASLWASPLGAAAVSPVH